MAILLLGDPAMWCCAMTVTAASLVSCNDACAHIFMTLSVEEKEKKMFSGSTLSFGTQIWRFLKLEEKSVSKNFKEIPMFASKYR